MEVLTTRGLTKTYRGKDVVNSVDFKRFQARFGKKLHD